MPESFASLLTVGGLGAVVVAALAFVKRIDAPEGSWYSSLKMWIDGNLFLASIIIAVVFGSLAFFVNEFGYMAIAEKYWAFLVVIWGASQILYNTQKGVSTFFRKE